MKKIILPYTFYGGVPGALSFFGLGFCVSLILAFSFFTGAVASFDDWTIAVAMPVLLSFYFGSLFLRNRITISNSGIKVNKLNSLLLTTSSEFVLWSSIKRVDVVTKEIKNTPRFGANQIKMLRIDCADETKPLDINATLYQSGDGLVVLGKYFYEMVPHDRISDHARRVLRQKIE